MSTIIIRLRAGVGSFSKAEMRTDIMRTTYWRDTIYFQRPDHAMGDGKVTGINIQTSIVL
jgi:hypothetical protein